MKVSFKLDLRFIRRTQTNHNVSNTTVVAVKWFSGGGFLIVNKGRTLSRKNTLHRKVSFSENFKSALNLKKIREIFGTDNKPFVMIKHRTNFDYGLTIWNCTRSNDRWSNVEDSKRYVQSSKLKMMAVERIAKWWKCLKRISLKI